MKARRLILAVSLLLPAGLASAQDASTLALSQGDIFSDDVGSVIGVSIVNGGTSTVGSAMVNCAFTARGRPAGSAGTMLYNILPGAKAQDQVHLMGARADKATCSIGTITAATN